MASPNLSTPSPAPVGLAVIGSTGSIGTQALDLVAAHPDRFRVDVLATGHNVGLLVEQCRRHRPSLAVIADESRYAELRDALAPLGIDAASGPQALADAMERPATDMVLTATVGYSGFEPTLRAIKAGKRIALANKETLVAGGALIEQMLGSEMARRVYPVDSEHSAIWQCLRGERPESVRKLVITASGGPFLRTPADRLAAVTPADALRHPNWSMGDKITIDSATMVNKAFEVIEARWLFGLGADKLRVVVHPQSVVHSMVEFTDGAVKAQLGTPDMHLPIAYALGMGERIAGSSPMLTLEKMAALTFEDPDTDRFPALNLAWEVLRRSGNSGAVFNAANEVANLAFRQGRIAYPDIYATIEAVLRAVPFEPSVTHDNIAASHDEATLCARALVGTPALP